MQSRVIDVEGLNLHLLEEGEGEPVLFLHGWPTNAQLWRHVLPVVGRGRRAIALDLPGFGQSDKPLVLDGRRVSYSFPFFERILSGALDALGIERCGLTVHDLGGPVGLYWAAKNPQRITELAILNTLVFPELSWAVKLFVASTFVPGLNRFLTGQYALKEAMKFGVQDKARITPQVAEIYQAPFRDRQSRKALLRSAQALHPKGFVTIAKGLEHFTETPVRLLYGEKDRILPDVAKTMSRLKTLLPHAELSRIAECGHFLQEDRPEEVAAALGAFFT